MYSIKRYPVPTPVSLDSSLHSNKNIIYQTPQQDLANGGLGDPINDGNGTTIQGPLLRTRWIAVFRVNPLNPVNRQLSIILVVYQIT